MKQGCQKFPNIAKKKSKRRRGSGDSAFQLLGSRLNNQTLNLTSRPLNCYQKFLEIP